MPSLSFSTMPQTRRFPRCFAGARDGTVAMPRALRTPMRATRTVTGRILDDGGMKLEISVRGGVEGPWAHLECNELAGARYVLMTSRMKII